MNFVVAPIRPLSNSSRGDLPVLSQTDWLSASFPIYQRNSLNSQPWLTENRIPFISLHDSEAGNRKRQTLGGICDIGRSAMVKVNSIAPSVHSFLLLRDEQTTCTIKYRSIMTINIGSIT